MSNKEKNVYIVNRGGHDFSMAERFGKLIFLSEGSINRYAVTAMYRQFSDILSNSNSHDYILPTGLSMMNVIAAAIFSFQHGRLNLLLFKEGDYITREIVISELVKRKH